MLKIFYKNNYLKIILIAILSLLCDYLFLSNINKIPGWDQGYHLSNLFKMNNISYLYNNNFNLIVENGLNITDNYRGPFTYLISSLLLQITGNSYKFAYISNHIFNIIALISIYQLGKILKNKDTGIYACIIFSFNPFIFLQRTDYLIDLSLTSFSSLAFLALTKWFLSKNKLSIYSVIFGIFLGFIFLIKPTGITLFIFSLLIVFLKKLKKSSKNYFFIEIILSISTFILIIYPWFLTHWLTIISSIINAWQWGIKYQDGLDLNTFKGWLYYLYIFPSFFGKFNFLIFGFIYFFQRIIRKIKVYNFDNQKINLWFLIFLLNNFLINSLMSTKDMRFLMPLFPIICIYLACILNSLRQKKSTDKFLKLIALSFLICTILIQQFSPWFKLSFINSEKNKKIDDWHHEDVIKSITETNPYLISTLAIIPDTKEINTFNFEAEAARQKENIAVRQIISNKINFKDDLKYFDWFLTKSGDQGVMTTESNNMLVNYLNDNESFEIYKNWILPDGENIYLYKRKTINSTLIKKDCTNNLPSIEIENFNDVIKIVINSKGSNINNNLLVNIKSGNESKDLNISLANDQIYPKLNPNSCFQLTQIIPTKLDYELKNYLYNVRRLSPSNKLNFSTKERKILINKDINEEDLIYYENKIEKILELGFLLKNGEFEELINTLGILSQSDPKQTYLKNSELIFKKRFKEEKNLDYIYAIAVSQIMQRKIPESQKTIEKIIKFDSNNPNIFLVESLIELYLLNPKKAEIAFSKYKSFNFSDDYKQEKHFINIIEGIISLINFNFRNGIAKFSL